MLSFRKFTLLGFWRRGKRGKLRIFALCFIVTERRIKRALQKKTIMRDHILKIGTRGSALALAQANLVRDRLLSAHNLPPQTVVIAPMSTQGDRVQNRALSAIGGKGLFTAEIESALSERRIDIAVHSTKDMPAELPEGLYLSAFLKREDPRDAFVSAKYHRLRELPHGARIGTSSIRRQALLRRLRPDLEITLLRGNVQTRLQKLEAGAVDGTFLAYAGLKRLGLADRVTELLDTREFIPAPGQGVIAIESRIGDKETDRLLEPLNDTETAITTACERAFMSALDGSCRTPLGAYARLEGGALNLHAMIITPDGKIFHETKLAEKMEIAARGAEGAKRLGEKAAKILRAQAGEAFFKDWF